MTSLFKYALALFLWIPAASTETARAETANPGEQADEIILLSGMGQTLSSWPGQLEAQFLQSRSPVPEDISHTVMRRMMSAYSEKEAHDLLRTYILRESNTEQRKGIAAWLNSQLGKRFQAAEAYLATAQGAAALEQWLADTSRPEPSARRVELVSDFERITQLTDSTLAIMEIIMRGQSAGINAGLDEDRQASESEISAAMDEKMKALRPVMGELIWRQLLPILHFSFREFTDRELEQYNGFLATESGSKLINIQKEGIEYVFASVMARAIDKVKK